MQTMKETAASVAAAAKSGMDKTKAAVGKKAEDMPTEVQKQDAGEKTATEKPGAASYSYSYSTTGDEGQSTGSHQMSALPGHGTGEPAGQVVEGTVKSHPIGKATGTGRPTTTTAHNTHAGGGGYSG